MKDPLVSLIIPMFNAESFIEECLKSASDQTYKNLEIIVVDDGSDDKSSEIVHFYIEKYPNIKYIKTQNQNASLTRRDGFEKASGELVCFLDADDVLDPKYVERLYQGMITTHTSIAACNIEAFTGVFKAVASPAKTKPYTLVSNAGSFASHYHLTDTNKLSLQTLPGKLFKRELLKNIDYDVLKTNIFEDNFIMVQIMRNVEEIGVINEVLYWYRQTGGSTSGGTIYSTVNYNGTTLNFIEFFRDIVMEYCRKMLRGPNVDAEIDKLCAAEFYNYARMVPELKVRIEYLEEKTRLEEERVKDRDAQIRAIINSKSYKIGQNIVSPARKIKSIITSRNK